jgi:hypothetical protein
MHSPNRKHVQIALGAAGIALLATVFAAPASAATPREPNPCAGRNVDSGTGGQDGAPLYKHVYGTWWNCGRTAGTDHVKINVVNAADGPCIAVPYGSTGSSDLHRSPWDPFSPDVKFGSWIRC